jgi:ketosteroid isomerase-like protein
MSEQENKKVVQAVFESFGRGDIAGLLGHVVDDVVWSAPGSSLVPYHGDRRGHEGVKEFFQQLGSNVSFERFELGELIAEGDKVVALGSERGRVGATGKAFDNDWAIVFTVRDGKVTNFFLYENTSAIAEAFS